MSELLEEKYILENAIDIPRNKNCAIYFLIRENKIIYIGRSVEVHARIRFQQGHITFDKVYIHKCERSDLNRLEREYIRKYRPLVNISIAENDVPTVQMDMDVSPNFKKSIDEICFKTRTAQAVLFDYLMTLYQRELSRPAPPLSDAEYGETSASDARLLNERLSARWLDAKGHE